MSQMTTSMKAHHQFLLTLIKEAMEAFIVHNKILEMIRLGGLSKEDWRSFAIQRYLAALPFEDVLRAGLAKAKEDDYVALAVALEKNLADETGLDAQGNHVPERAHDTWRHDFYQGLGISDAILKRAFPSEGTKAYMAVMHGLRESADPLVIAGALLILEATIPAEFKKMREGRDKVFPEMFVDQATDDKEMREQKAKARLYLDDHFLHDASSHFPELMQALLTCMKTKEDEERVARGAHQIIEAKKVFYE